MAEILHTPAQWIAYLRRRRLRILMYHRITDDPGDPLAVAPARFRQELACLAQLGYRGLSLEQALAQLDSPAWDGRGVCLTFDDGQADFYLHALPVLQRYGFQATLFVVAGCVGGANRWSSYRKGTPLLDWEQLEASAGAGCEIGSHSLTHPDLRRLPPERLAAELVGARQQLEERLGLAVRSFSYPGGSFAEREVQAVRQAGYQAAVSVGGRWGNGRETDRLRLKREKMLRSDTLDEFRRKVSGYYELHYLWGRLVKTRPFQAQTKCT